MKLFRNYTFTPTQIALFKTYLFVGGLIIGSYFAEHITPWLKLLVVVWVVLMIYFVHGLLKKKF